jgi:hypothetical protein
MIKQNEGESRTRYLLRVAAEFIDQHPNDTIDYDETTCDGYCLREELIIAYQSIK